MARLIAILTVCFFIYGCNPYIKRSILTKEDIEEEYSFLYGNFCGPGWPSDEKINEALKDNKKLLPLDDLDVLCYAHDFCYIQTFLNNNACDDAFEWFIVKYQFANFSKSCTVLMTEMFSAFFVKPYKEGEDEFKTKVVRFTTFLLGPFSILVWILNVPNLLVNGYPEEGSCNTGNDNSPENIVKIFENEYRRSPLNDGNHSISIPLP